jgi:hypothetical protein
MQTTAKLRLVRLRGAVRLLAFVVSESALAHTSPRRPRVSIEEGVIPLHGGAQTAGLLQMPDRPSACLVLAHGAGVGMRHAFMAAVAAGLAERGLATLRFDFDYMHRGRKIPDRPPVACGAVRAAVAVAGDLLPDLPLLAGGKSFGGRMTSEAQAEAPMPGVRGLIFLGFRSIPPANRRFRGPSI